jgi:UDP-N-acetyl-D-mannosaminuronate dehydrogenase
VWGTGYIGFSTMANFAAQGVVCLGTDISDSIVNSINDGKIPVPNMEYWLGFDTSYLIQSGTMKATMNWKSLLEPDIAVHMIAIPTEKSDQPWDGALTDVTAKIATNIGVREDPPLVIIESTLTPNKTDTLVIPIFEKNGLKVGKDILVGVAPRRDWFISPEKNLKSLPRIVGGSTPETTQLMIDVLGIVCDRLIPAPDHRHAEIVKSVENAYRHAEITLANQLTLAYPNLNMTEVLRLVGTKWNVNVYHPSFGTGGYCLGAEEYVVAAYGGGIHFEPIRTLYERTREMRIGEVKVLSYVPNDKRVTFRKVTAMSRRVSSTLQLKTVGGHSLTATPNHIMYVHRRKLWKRLACELHKGDEMAFVNRLPYFKFAVDYPDYVKRGRGRRGHVIDLQHFAAECNYKKKIGTGTQRLSTGMGKSYRTVPRFLRIEPQLAFLIGLYAAEGCVTEDRGGLRTYISLNRNERELINAAKAILDGYGIRYSEFDERVYQTHQIRVSGGIWGTFIREMVGGASAIARLPEFFVLWHDVRVRRALLSGLLNGDCSVSARTGTVEFYTVSRTLQQQTIYLLRSLGLAPTLNTSRDPPMIRLQGVKSREFAKSVFIGDKLRRLDRYHRSAQDRRQTDRTNRRPSVKTVTENGREVVYSLDVEKTHNFFTTSGWLVHNCIPLSSKYVLEGAEKPEYLTILRETVKTDESLPRIVADRIADGGIKSVGILGLSYKGDLKVHILSPTLGIVRRLRERGVNVKVNDPYYNSEEISRLTGAEPFQFPDGLSEFECILIVAGHRAYKAIAETQLKQSLKKCRLIIDNLEETWRHLDWSSSPIRYYVAGDSNWLSAATFLLKP